MKTAPDPKDVQEFQFKQSNTSQVVDAFTSISLACSLLAADKRRGLLYIGQHNKIIILKPGESSDPEWRIEFEIPVSISKLMLSCDCSYLAVVPHGPSVLIYDVHALVKSNLHLLHEIRVSSLTIEAFVNDLQWNPTIPGMLCTVASDYTIGSFQIKDKERTIELKALEKLNGLDVLCAAWSPKGKQIVLGCKNGNMIQLKPDLKAARMIPGPVPYIGGVISILWISNYQFCAAYVDNEQRINVLIVDAPRGEANAIFTCYEDITYGIADMEGERLPPSYYFDHVPEWGLIIAASSNSSEVAVLGSTDGGATWSQWQLVDSGRAELPLICTSESYPVGLAIDKSPTRILPWGADSTLPNPVPILHILATSGQLCSFHMVNLIPNCPAINSPPTEIVSPPPQLRASVGPTEASIIMNGIVTSTPRPKQLESPSERPKPPPTGNLFDKLLKGSGFLTQSLIEKPIQQEQKLEVPSMEVKIEPPKEVHVQETVRPDIKSVQAKETPPQEPVEQKPTIEDETRDIRAYMEEHNLFEKELRNRLEPQTWECGTEEERQKLVQTSAVINQFLRELNETTNSLSSDIAYLKALLLQSFAWVEETKSKNAATNDITTRNCGDNSKISNLQKLYYYTQTQLTQANKILDLEWLDNKSQEMSRMRIPHLEFVYQNLILHNKIVQKEKSKLEKLKKDWKLITRNNNIFGLNRSMSNLSVTSSKSSVSLPRNTSIIEGRCKAIALKTLSFTQGKQIKLREHLAASTPRIIKPVNPSPIQDRLEATLSSLASRGAMSDTTTVDSKNKIEEIVSEQAIITKQAAEKPKQQSPLALLNSIVARIGTNEANNVPAQSKPQSKQPAFTIAFPATSGSKPVQTEKKSSPPVTTVVPQSIKPKQDTITFSQVNASTHPLPNLIKSFPKVDSISFGAPIPKPDETSTQKPAPKEAAAKSDKEAAPSTNSFKVETNFFGTGVLKDALSPEASSGKPQAAVPNTSLKFGVPVAATAVAKTDSAATFSFASPSTVSTIAKSPSQNVTPQAASAQTFSFAAKPSSTTTPFNLKLTQAATAPQVQESLNLSELCTGLQASNQSPVSSSNANVEGKYNYKPTFGSPSFQASLVQDATNTNEITISLVSGASSKETITVTPSVTIEQIPATAELKVPSFQTSAVQALPATSASPLYSNQVIYLRNTSNISIFGGTSAPATSTFSVTTSSSTFGIQAATTSPTSMFSGFSTTPVTSTTPSTPTTTSSAVSPFQASMAKPTFGEATALFTPSSINANTSTASTLSFGSIRITNATTATTSTTSVFGKPALTMNAQFPSTPPAVSSTTNAFGKPITNTAAPLFGSPANTSLFGGMPTTSANTLIFSGNSSASIFGANTQTTSAGSIFGGNSTSMNTFGTPQKSIFDSNAQKSGSIFGRTSNAGSFFGGAAGNASSGVAPPGTTSVFGGGTNTSPMGMEQPGIGAQGFGQTPTIEAKPVFGSPPTFGSSKPIFGGGFGASTFGASPAPPAFGSPPAMGANPAPVDNNMSKVFGNVGGNTTFETLATQSGGLSFSSLAQKSPEAEKPPAFSGGSSFSSWR
ncbi:nuclear pore complex protein Nup214 isoform X2 [Andrena cerasifolii]|uniref:nuclear pore complex protein Nup214 isoform X2 n=1 Tax=Andrena cerasifolii TaxID=2819439 RepID=UPI004037BCD8